MYNIQGENSLVGSQYRERDEAPAAEVILKEQKELETFQGNIDVAIFKPIIEKQLAEKL
ncbi:hypothetical protein [Staphylococcus aureus]|uniref:hypothetical protein n=1 Tax=Staphylococcus aureus TaxID=1280 RepID=UPI000B33854B|nr:hypothetical protein [Staphylococcus aureus]